MADEDFDLDLALDDILSHRKTKSKATIPPKPHITANGGKSETMNVTATLNGKSGEGPQMGSKSSETDSRGQRNDDDPVSTFRTGASNENGSSTPGSTEKVSFGAEHNSLTKSTSWIDANPAPLSKRNSAASSFGRPDALDGGKRTSDSPFTDQSTFTAPLPPSQQPRSHGSVTLHANTAADGGGDDDEDVDLTSSEYGSRRSSKANLTPEVRSFRAPKGDTTPRQKTLLDIFEGDNSPMKPPQPPMLFRSPRSLSFVSAGKKSSSEKVNSQELAPQNSAGAADGLPNSNLAFSKRAEGAQSMNSAGRLSEDPDNGNANRASSIVNLASNFAPTVSTTPPVSHNQRRPSQPGEDIVKAERTTGAPLMEPNTSGPSTSNHPSNAVTRSLPSDSSIIAQKKIQASVNPSDIREASISSAPYHAEQQSSNVSLEDLVDLEDEVDDIDELFPVKSVHRTSHGNAGGAGSRALGSTNQADTKPGVHPSPMFDKGLPVQPPAAHWLPTFTMVGEEEHRHNSAPNTDMAQSSNITSGASDGLLERSDGPDAAKIAAPSAAFLVGEGDGRKNWTSISHVVDTNQHSLVWPSTQKPEKIANTEDLLVDVAAKRTSADKAPTNGEDTDDEGTPFDLLQRPTIGGQVVGGGIKKPLDTPHAQTHSRSLSSNQTVPGPKMDDPLSSHASDGKSERRLTNGLDTREFKAEVFQGARKEDNKGGKWRDDGNAEEEVDLLDTILALTDESAWKAQDRKQSKEATAAVPVTRQQTRLESESDSARASENKPIAQDLDGTASSHPATAEDSTPNTSTSDRANSGKNEPNFGTVSSHLTTTKGATPKTFPSSEENRGQNDANIHVAAAKSDNGNVGSNGMGVHMNGDPAITRHNNDRVSWSSRERAGQPGTADVSADTVAINTANRRSFVQEIALPRAENPLSKPGEPVSHAANDTSGRSLDSNTSGSVHKNDETRDASNKVPTGGAPPIADLSHAVRGAPAATDVGQVAPTLGDSQKQTIAGKDPLGLGVTADSNSSTPRTPKHILTSAAPKFGAVVGGNAQNQSDFPAGLNVGDVVKPASSGLSSQSKTPRHATGDHTHPRNESMDSHGVNESVSKANAADIGVTNRLENAEHLKAQKTSTGAAAERGEPLPLHFAGATGAKGTEPAPEKSRRLIPDFMVAGGTQRSAPNTAKTTDFTFVSVVDVARAAAGARNPAGATATLFGGKPDSLTPDLERKGGNEVGVVEADPRKTNIPTVPFSSIVVDVLASARIADGPRSAASDVTTKHVMGAGGDTVSWNGKQVLMESNSHSPVEVGEASSISDMKKGTAVEAGSASLHDRSGVKSGIRGASGGSRKEEDKDIDFAAAFGATSVATRDGIHSQDVTLGVNGGGTRGLRDEGTTSKASVGSTAWDRDGFSEQKQDGDKLKMTTPKQDRRGSVAVDALGHLNRDVPVGGNTEEAHVHSPSPTDASKQMTVGNGDGGSTHVISAKITNAGELSFATSLHSENLIDDLSESFVSSSSLSKRSNVAFGSQDIRLGLASVAKYESIAEAKSAASDKHISAKPLAEMVLPSGESEVAKSGDVHSSSHTDQTDPSSQEDFDLRISSGFTNAGKGVDSKTGKDGLHIGEGVNAGAMHKPANDSSAVRTSDDFADGSQRSQRESTHEVFPSDQKAAQVLPENGAAQTKDERFVHVPAQDSSTDRKHHSLNVDAADKGLAQSAEIDFAAAHDGPSGSKDGALHTDVPGAATPRMPINVDIGGVVNGEYRAIFNTQDASDYARNQDPQTNEKRPLNGNGVDEMRERITDAEENRDDTEEEDYHMADDAGHFLLSEHVDQTGDTVSEEDEDDEEEEYDPINHGESPRSIEKSDLSPLEGYGSSKKNSIDEHFPVHVVRSEKAHEPITTAAAADAHRRQSASLDRGLALDQTKTEKQHGKENDAVALAEPKFGLWQSPRVDDVLAPSTDSTRMTSPFADGESDPVDHRKEHYRFAEGNSSVSDTADFTSREVVPASGPRHSVESVNTSAIYACAAATGTIGNRNENVQSPPTSSLLVPTETFSAVHAQNGGPDKPQSQPSDPITRHADRSDFTDIYGSHELTQDTGSKVNDGLKSLPLASTSSHDQGTTNVITKEEVSVRPSADFWDDFDDIGQTHKGVDDVGQIARHSGVKNEGGESWMAPEKTVSILDQAQQKSAFDFDFDFDRWGPVSTAKPESGDTIAKVNAEVSRGAVEPEPLPQKDTRNLVQGASGGFDGDKNKNVFWDLANGASNNEHHALTEASHFQTAPKADAHSGDVVDGAIGSRSLFSFGKDSGGVGKDGGDELEPSKSSHNPYLDDFDDHFFDANDGTVDFARDDNPKAKTHETGRNHSQNLGWSEEVSPTTYDFATAEPWMDFPVHESGKTAGLPDEALGEKDKEEELEKPVNSRPWWEDYGHVGSGLVETATNKVDILGQMTGMDSDHSYDEHAGHGGFTMNDGDFHSANKTQKSHDQEPDFNPSSADGYNHETDEHDDHNDDVADDSSSDEASADDLFVLPDDDDENEALDLSSPLERLNKCKRTTGILLRNQRTLSPVSLFLSSQSQPHSQSTTSGSFGSLSGGLCGLTSPATSSWEILWKYAIKCLALSRLVFGVISFDSMAAMVQLSEVYLLNGLFEQALSHAEQAKRMWGVLNQIGGIGQPIPHKGKVCRVLCQLYLALVFCNIDKKSFEQARGWLERAEKMVKFLETIPERYQKAIQEARAALLANEGHVDEAIAQYGQ
ncbi:hypothetical protein HK102_000225, partial [Quaeritorhiza haematococci]